MAHDVTKEEAHSLLPPFTAYHGDEPYIFVSYSHQDKAIVYPELMRLHEAGYRIWYDEGIVPGEDWTENIETALLGCSLFIVFLSSNAVKSKFVKREMHLAVDRDKTCLTVYLEETQLPVGWNLHLSPIQAIFQYDIPDELFWTKMQEALPASTRAVTVIASPVVTPVETLAWVQLNSTPSGASVFMDGNPWHEPTPCHVTCNLEMDKTRIVEVAVQHPDYHAQLYHIALTRGATANITATLIPKAAQPDIAAEPPRETPKTRQQPALPESTQVLKISGEKPFMKSLAFLILFAAAFVVGIFVRLVLNLKPSVRTISNFTQGSTAGEENINPKDQAKIVWVPAGEFLMGSTENDNEACPDEKPQHLVYLDGYWIYKMEVTVAQYRKFCEATGRSMPKAPNWGWLDTHPIVNISWDDANAYALWAGASLPTEAEWEKAARGTDGRQYPWGNDWSTEKCIHFSNSQGKTAPVGNNPAETSPFGCLDMAGNAWEWCADWKSN